MRPAELAELFLLKLVFGTGPLTSSVIAVPALSALEEDEAFLVLHGFNGVGQTRLTQSVRRTYRIKGSTR